MDIIVILLVIFAAVMGAGAQLIMKKGMTIIGEKTLFEMARGFVGYLFTNPYIFAGIAIYALSTIVYLTALSRGELSFVFPIISVSYIFAALLAFFVLGEKISVVRWIGILTIVTGVFLVVKS